MGASALSDLVAKVRGLLEAGAWRELPAIGIPELAWYQPGSSRLGGIHRGAKAVRVFLNEIGRASEDARFTAFGTAVFNRGVALVPATWVARRGEALMQSQGALLIAMHAGKVYEFRWFPDDTLIEDAFWNGAPEPEIDATPSIDTLFEDAVARSRKLKSRPTEATLLELYALYKQSAEGDAHAKRPGPLDIVGRAKYDAWAKLKGVAREDAMQRYIGLVASLEEKTAA